jgi:hypothetical protein
MKNRNPFFIAGILFIIFFCASLVLGLGFPDVWDQHGLKMMFGAFVVPAAVLLYYWWKQ